MKPNDQINNYTLLGECGKGSFGKVFLAQRDDGKYVAFKVVSLLGDAGERELQAIESYRKCPLCESLLEIFDFVIQSKGLLQKLKVYFYDGYAVLAKS